MTASVLCPDCGSELKAAPTVRCACGWSERLPFVEPEAAPRSEKEIEAEIIAALRSAGFDVTKTSAAVHAKGVTPGTPDLYARSARRKFRCWIEVKNARGRLSPAQVGWHAAEREAGGTVIVARGTEDLAEVIGMEGKG